MQVKGIKSWVFRSSNKTRGNQKKMKGVLDILNY